MSLKSKAPQLRQAVGVDTLDISHPSSVWETDEEGSYQEGAWNPVGRMTGMGPCWVGQHLHRQLPCRDHLPPELPALLHTRPAPGLCGYTAQAQVSVSVAGWKEPWTLTLQICLAGSAGPVQGYRVWPGG